MPVRILLVEDFAPMRQLISGMLRKRPEFQVVGEVADGLEAVQRAVDLQPDLILLDLSLPGITGLKAAERIRTLVPYAQILFVSQEISPAIVRESFRLGGRGYVHKSSAYEDLMPAIDAVLGYRRFLSESLQYPGRAEIHPRHVAQFYWDEAGLLQYFVRFTATAMRAGDSTILMATQPHLERVAQSLKAQGLDIDHASQHGAHIALDANELIRRIMHAGTADCAQFVEGLRTLITSATQANKRTNPRVAIAGECCGLLCARGNRDAALQIEEKGHELIQAHDNVDILCAYPMDVCKPDDPALERICALHQSIHCQSTGQQRTDVS